MKNSALAWKFLVWVLFACAVMAYESRLIFVAIIIGAFAVFMFLVDIRVHMADAREESAIGSLLKEEGRGSIRWLLWLILAFVILLSGQLIMRLLVNSDVPTGLAKWCLICHR